MQIGVVAIGRNEGERLRKCLCSVPPGVPIIYVDSGSTDGSLALARQAGADIVNLDLTRPFTAARARNEGLLRLLERWPELPLVQFVDGDCEIEQGWLETAIDFLRDNPAVAAVCGRRRERYPHASPYNGLCDQEWDTPVGQARACGGDALMRVESLNQVGAFDPTLTAGEEPELCERLRSRNWIIWRLDTPMTIHDASMFRFRQWWLRAVRSGYGYAQVWFKTVRGPTTPLYGRELARAYGWTLGVPLFAVLMCIATSPLGLLLAPVVWLAQLTRLARRNGLRTAAYLMIGKVAEALGASRYVLAIILRRHQNAIVYK